MLNGSTIRIRISSCYRVHKIVIYNIIMIILLLFFYIFLQITRVIPLFLLKNASAHTYIRVYDTKRMRQTYRFPIFIIERAIFGTRRIKE